MSLRREHGIVGVVCTLALAFAGSATMVRAQRIARDRASDRARDASLPKPRDAVDGFVGSARCESCHPDAYASWHRSWHRTMTQKVEGPSVIAEFDGRELPHPDGEHRVEQRGDEYWVQMPDANWLLDRAVGGPEAVDAKVPMRWQRAVMSTGAHNMQMYWVAAEPGRRLIAFPFTWSVEARAWVANEATLLRPYEPWVVYSWNDVCLKCHAVAGATSPGLGPDPDPDPGMQTEVAELGIACEACHGPGRDHVEARARPLQRYLGRLEDRTHDATAATSDIVNPGRLDARRSSEICGQCHSASVFADHQAWLGRGSEYRPGARLTDSTRVVRHPLRSDQPWIDDLLDHDADYLSGRFWGDGMIRISGRDYNGMIESPCMQDPEFGCASCHEMHGDDPVDQLKPTARDDDDRQCTQCHSQWVEPATVELHTRHRPDSSGSSCVNCHMPHTVYGLTKAIRSHQISVPSAEESEAYGRPNACNLCHLDRTLAWTAAELERGWGIVSPPLERGADARAAVVEWLVRGDAGQRALAAWALGWSPAQASSGSDWIAPLLVRALADDYAAARWTALRSLRSLPGYADVDWDLAGALELEPLADFTKLDARWPGSARVDPAVYAGPEGFDEAAWQRDHAERDERVVDLRE